MAEDQIIPPAGLTLRIYFKMQPVNIGNGFQRSRNTRFLTFQ